jgi:hypothetical protein
MGRGKAAARGRTMRKHRSVGRFFPDVLAEV